MQFSAKTKFVRFSPYKLRPIADVIRGKAVPSVLNWLATYRIKRVRPFKKLLESAVANAQNLKELRPEQLVVKEVCVDQGPIVTYFKPGAMGRANMQRKRMSHISVVLQPAQEKVAQKKVKNKVKK